MAAETKHGDVTAWSYSAASVIFLSQNGQSVRVDPADLRAILEAHDPPGFYDD